jgi:hypothetical protein
MPISGEHDFKSVNPLTLTCCIYFSYRFKNIVIQNTSYMLFLVQDLHLTRPSPGATQGLVRELTDTAVTLGNKYHRDRYLEEG